MNQKLIPQSHKDRVNSVVYSLELLSAFISELTTDSFVMSNSDYATEIYELDKKSRSALAEFKKTYGNRL